MSKDLFDDDYDPLAPVDVSTPADEEAEDPDDLEINDLDGFDDDPLGDADDGGFGGADGLARIWFDDDGRLHKVRLSPVWFKKLAPGQSLEQVFRQAFLASNISVAQQPESERLDRAALDFGDLPPFSEEAMETYLGLMAEHRERWHAAIARAEAQPPARPRRARGKSKGVLLTLDEHGHPAEVQFDDDWLDEAQVGSICINVVAAAHKAYARYVPMTNEHLSELERFRIEHEVLIAGFAELLKPRGN